MKLYIKYMVSIRCKMIVKDQLIKIGIDYIEVNLGEVLLEKAISEGQKKLLKTALLSFGLEVMDDKKAMLIEKIKNVIIEMVHYSEDLPKVNFSVYLSENLKYDYTYLSNLFSETEGSTIEHYIWCIKLSA